MKWTPIQSRRINLGLNDIEKVAQMLRISKSTIRHIEAGYRTPSLKLAIKMADIYECTVDEICNDLNLK